MLRCKLSVANQRLEMSEELSAGRKKATRSSRLEGPRDTDDVEKFSGLPGRLGRLLLSFLKFHCRLVLTSTGAGLPSSRAAGRPRASRRHHSVVRPSDSSG